MLLISGIIFLLFFPACLNVLREVIWGQQLTHQLLYLGMFLFCIEQASMAAQDLRQIASARKQVKDLRLNTFYTITIATIFIELLGFYAAPISFGGGSILILLSQVWFNLFAGIKISLLAESIIQTWKVTERFPVLIADIIGLLLVSLWMLHIGSLWITWILFGMPILYCSIKLALSFQSIPEYK
ncbi:MAG: hypothetical protein H0X31_10030 [Nostocaceae cyanobacterium]|nr:hypothetical protein [Nostocaceae cyanobacterium]